MAKENKTMYAILGLLNHEDLSGYDIKKRIDNSLKLFWDASFGQIYPALKSLESSGWIDRRNEVSELGPERITYSITNEGRNQLIQWLRIPVEKEVVKYDILLKLFFGSALTPVDNMKNIGDFKDRNTENLKLLQYFKSNLEQVMYHHEPDHIYYYLTVLFGEKVHKAYLEWADEAVKMLENLKKTEENIGGDK